MGDVIHAFPAVHLLRRHFSESSITWLVNDVYAELVERLADVNHVVPFRRARWGNPRYWPELLSAIRELRGNKYDVAIDFQGLLRSGFIAYLSGAPRRVGFRQAREGSPFFYTDKILVPGGIKHAIEKNVSLVSSVFDVPTSVEMPALALSPTAERKAEKLLERGMPGAGTGHPLMAVAPASRWASKSWPPQFFADVIREVKSSFPQTQVWLVGTRPERETGDRVTELSAPYAVQNLMGQINLATLIELLRKSHVLVTNDSGPMHLAAALGTRVIALFGPTDPDLTGPYGKTHQVFRGVCDKAPCMSRECPDGEPRCWHSVDHLEVANCVKAYFQENFQYEKSRP